jgi:hypothetical protein
MDFKNLRSQFFPLALNRRWSIKIIRVSDMQNHGHCRVFLLFIQPFLVVSCPKQRIKQNSTVSTIQLLKWEKEWKEVAKLQVKVNKSGLVGERDSFFVFQRNTIAIIAAESQIEQYNNFMKQLQNEDIHYKTAYQALRVFSSVQPLCGKTLFLTRLISNLKNAQYEANNETEQDVWLLLMFTVRD